MDELVTALASPDVVVREGARRQLRALGTVAIPALLDGAASHNVFVAEPSGELLTALGPDAFDELMVAGERARYRNRPGCDEAIAAVVRMGPVVLPRAIAKFLSQPAGFPLGVLRQLGPQSVEPLLPLLDHPNPEVRQWTGSLLVEIGDPRAADACLKALGHQDLIVRWYCARLLGKVRDRRALEPLLAGLEDESWGVRQACASSLGKLYEARFLRPLARLARGDPEKDVRDTASNVLINYSQDPVGVRLGRRYAREALSPRYDFAIVFQALLKIGVTCALLLALAFLVPRAASRDGGQVRLVLVVGMLVLGGAWGYAVDQLWGAIENLLLFACVPMTGLLGYVVLTLRFGAREPGRLWLRALGCFYVGYLVGSLALWGYLGF